MQQAGADRTRPGLQFGQVGQAAGDPEVGRVHHRLDPKGAAVLQVLFHAGMAPEGVDCHAAAAAVDRGPEHPAGLVLGLAAPRVALEQHLDVLDAAVHVTAGAQLSDGGRGWNACVVVVAVLLHHSTVCRDCGSSHLAKFAWRAPRRRMSGTLLVWQQHLARLAPTT